MSFAQPRDRLRAPQIDSVLLQQGEVAGAEDQLGAPAGELVERCGLLGDDRRVLQDDVRDLGPETDGRRPSRGRREERPHVLVVGLVGAVARPETEPLEQLDQVEELVERLLWKKLVAEADGAIIPRDGLCLLAAGDRCYA